MDVEKRKTKGTMEEGSDEERKPQTSMNESTVRKSQKPRAVVFKLNFGSGLTGNNSLNCS
jgi:hypothetical protein